jgi:hypothetical protein
MLGALLLQPSRKQHRHKNQERNVRFKAHTLAYHIGWACQATICSGPLSSTTIGCSPRTLYPHPYPPTRYEKSSARADPPAHL